MSIDPGPGGDRLREVATMLTTLVQATDVTALATMWRGASLRHKAEPEARHYHLERSDARATVRFIIRN
jgi:hypothetical protein